MKKYIFLLLIVVIVVSCEKDDFCTQEVVTPNLIIKFMDYRNTEALKARNSLYVWAEAKDSLYKNSSLDSIIIPLNTASNTTVYNIASGKDSISKLTLNYETEHVFVSRSCGFKSIFNNVKITETLAPISWIDSIATKEILTIDNQINAHIIIYH